MDNTSKTLVESLIDVLENVVETYADRTIYRDEVGEKICCGSLPGKPHADDCVINKAKEVLAESRSVAVSASHLEAERDTVTDLRAAPQLKEMISTPSHSGRVPAIPPQWSASLNSCWPEDPDNTDGDWVVGHLDEDGNHYDVLTVEASQYDADGESQKIAEAIVSLWSFAAAATLPGAP